jgi:acyl-CoA-binding protein
VLKVGANHYVAWDGLKGEVSKENALRNLAKVKLKAPMNQG